jgi:hypothetical protein
MRNLFLVLLLANLLLFAWNRWVVPPPRPAGATFAGSPRQREAPLAAASPAPPGNAVVAAPQPQDPARPVTAAPAVPSDTCVQVGPLPAAEAAAELGRSLASQGIPAATIARDTQVWVGNWIQIGGFASRAAADEARRRLVDGGLADAYLMQEGPEPVISLGVFREKERADRVAAIARGLGFDPVSTNRYRPAVEYWLLARIPAAGASPRDELPLPRSGLLRIEPVECPRPGSVAGLALAGSVPGVAPSTGSAAPGAGLSVPPGPPAGDP